MGGSLPELFNKAFHDARIRALLASVLDLMRRQPTAMLAFDDVRTSLNVRGQRTLGRQVVPLANIIGSQGRYHDFDRRFLPRTDLIQHRWSSIERAMKQGVNLPAVELYKLSDVYFVRDGNHRVSVARQLGRIDIDAEVTELLVDVPLRPSLSVRTLLFAQEYSDFLEWTGLHDLRPDERIEFSELGGYLDLVRHINRQRAALAQEQRREIGRDEAVASWYDTVYVPIVREIRDLRLLQRFPGRTEADLYRWIVAQAEALAADDPGPDGAPGDPRSDERSQGSQSWATMVMGALRRAIQRLK